MLIIVYFALALSLIIVSEGTVEEEPKKTKNRRKK